MLGSISEGLRRVGVLGGVALLAGGGFFAACAPSTLVGTDVPRPLDQIASVGVHSGPEGTVITLAGLQHPLFTAFSQQDPDRLIIDLPSLHAGSGLAPMAIYDGLVDELEPETFSTGMGDEITRLVIGLTSPVEFDVRSTEAGLEIHLAAIAAWPEPETEASIEVEDDPWTIEPMGAPDLAAGWSAPPATMLTAIETEDTGDGTLIRLVADGAISGVVTFTLDDPDRLVIDLTGLSSSDNLTRIDLGSAHAARIRIGNHADMVRVVLDAGNAPNAFDGRRIIPAPNGLLIALGSGEALEAALTEATATSALASVPPMDVELPEDAREPGEFAAEPVDFDSDSGWETVSDQESEAGFGPDLEEYESELELAAEPSSAQIVTVYGIVFDAQRDRDRIVVISDNPLDYVIYAPDSETAVVSFGAARIDAEAAVRIAPEAGGPVSLITAFDQPDVEGREARLVVKHAIGLVPEISRHGSLLFVDFPRRGVAATLPVLNALPLDDRSDGQVEAEVAAESIAGDPLAPLSLPALPRAATSPAALPPVPLPTPSAMASLEPPAGIDVLVEGGLIPGKEYSGRRISLDFKEVDIADVLRLIAEVSDLNVIAGDEVSGSVTLRLVDVPWDQALDVILLTKNLGFMRVGNVLRVAPASLIKTEEESRLQERRAKEKLEDLVVKLQPVNYATVGDVSQMVMRLLSPRGTVNVDTRTNTLIIKDIPSVVDEATALVKAIDTQTPQVMIEAKIVEASLDFSREFGSTWTAGVQPLIDGFDPASGPSPNRLTNAFRLRDSNNFSSLNPITAGPTALANLGAFILDEKINLDLQLQAAEVNGDGKVISSPRVVTLDNSEARIEQGVSIPFQTFENGDAAIEFIDAVLSLTVTPHITADRSIIMKIKVSRNAPDDSVFTLTGSPAIAKNEIKTEVLVKDGRTLVLGGIYVVDKSQRQSRVPYLHKIPILGAAFRSNEVSDSRKELLIFVTPTIVVPDQEDAV